MSSKSNKLIRNSTAGIEEYRTVRKFRIDQIKGKREVKRLVDKISVIRKFRITAGDCKNYNTDFFNLEKVVIDATIRKYRIVQDQLFESDFDRMLREIEGCEINKGLKNE